MKTFARAMDKAEIIRRLRNVRPDGARRWGTMSAHQMVCHLTDSCRMMTGELVASDATGPLQRTLIKWIALYAPLRWPRGIPTRPEVDPLRAGTSPADFANDVSRLEALLEAITVHDERFHARRHPIFGQMSRAAWLRWAYLHADHHLRQFGA